ncbi:hypothetical protein HN587_00365 [Candidatus Woesearchaeota archaeon]|nr:hypothetical protein [Candidatus Woesearchaeota archaeon]
MKKLYSYLTILFVLILCLSSLAMASDLQVVDIEVDVDGDEDKGVSNDGGTVDIFPGAKLEIKLKLENVGDQEISNIDLNAIIEEIDDGDDLETDVDYGDLKTGKENTEKFYFQLPLIIDQDDTYQIIITADGKNEDKEVQELEVIIDLEVDKESHEVVFDGASLSSAEVTCGAKPQLDLRVVNIGEGDEEVQVKIFTDDSDLFFEEFTMDSDVSDPDNIYEKNLAIDTTDWKEGTYKIKSYVFFNKERDLVKSEIDLSVKCPVKKIPVDTTDDSDDDNFGSDNSDKPNTSTDDDGDSLDNSKVDSTIAVTTPPTSSGNVVVKSSANIVSAADSSKSTGFFEKNKTLTIIIITEILVILIVVLLILLVLRHRRGRK